MQEKQKDKNQLEDYFQAAANRGSMFSRSEIEQLISLDKKLNPEVIKGKTNATKILTIMTLIIITIAALIWMINPEEQKIAEKENTVINAKKSSVNKAVEEGNIKSKTKNLTTETVNSEVKQNLNETKENKQKTEAAKSVNEIKNAEKKEQEELNNNQVKIEKQAVISVSESPKSSAENNKDDKQIRLEGIKFIELTREELLQIGFSVNGDTTTFIEEGPITLAFCKDGTLISQNFIKKERTGLEGKDYIFPDFITDDLGGWRMYKSGDDLKRKDPLKYSDLSRALMKINFDTINTENQNDAQNIASERAKLETEEYFIDKINTFIPIRIRTGINYTIEDSLEKRWRPDVILWYEVTDDFIKTLPKDLRKKIENEYAQITKQTDKSENTSSSNCEYFEVCRSTLKSASDVIIFPNPALETTNMRFNLKTEISLRVNLFNISGRLVKELKSFSKFNPGQHQLPLDLNGITEGMYLIVLESEKGETNIQRLVKGKN